MALLQVNFFSKALSRIVTAHMYLPSDTQPEFIEDNPHYERETKILYLLHGFSGDSTDWISGSNVMDVSRRYNLAIVMPSGENSFYVDRQGTGTAYETFIAKELFDFVTLNFGLSTAKEDNFIGGLSMGGFGALRIGAKYNKKYGAAIGFSSALIIHDIAGCTSEEIDNMPVKIADYEYYRNIFGDLMCLEESEYNPEYIVRDKILKGEKLPPVYMACGTEDVLLKRNREYKEFLRHMNVDVTYRESEGGHDWKFWAEYLEPAVKWAIEKSYEKNAGCNFPHGDMPGDKIEINQEHIVKAKIIFEELMKILPHKLEESEHGKIVISVSGGSGVGKTEIASLLAYYLDEKGIGSYILSGDNYPRRIPMYNDAERLRVFRNAGIQSLVKSQELNSEIVENLRNLQRKGEDANEIYIQQYPWFMTYFRGAEEGLKAYLGTEKEIDFNEIGDIIKRFKAGEEKIWLKRMGRSDEDLWYEKEDFTDKSVLIVEWTHGNSDNYKGVDIPVLLNSTPEETIAHRRSRNRDGKVDSPFTMLVLKLEQKLLDSQAHKAKIILSKQGKILSYEEYRGLMDENK